MKQRTAQCFKTFLQCRWALPGHFHALCENVWPRCFLRLFGKEGEFAPCHHLINVAGVRGNVLWQTWNRRAHLDHGWGVSLQREICRTGAGPIVCRFPKTGQHPNARPRGQTKRLKPATDFNASAGRTFFGEKKVFGKALVDPEMGGHKRASCQSKLGRREVLKLSQLFRAILVYCSTCNLPRTVLGNRPQLEAQSRSSTTDPSDVPAATQVCAGLKLRRRAPKGCVLGECPLMH